MLRRSDWSKDVPRYTKWTIRLTAFRICVTCYRQKLTVLPGKLILCQKRNTLKSPFLLDLEGKRLTQVSFPTYLPTRENLGVWQFKLAMWEVGGIKIERMRARHFFYMYAWKLVKEINILVKRSVPENFQQGNFSGVSTHRILTPYATKNKNNGKTT